MKVLGCDELSKKFLGSGRVNFGGKYIGWDLLNEIKTLELKERSKMVRRTNKPGRGTVRPFNNLNSIVGKVGEYNETSSHFKSNTHRHTVRQRNTGFVQDFSDCILEKDESLHQSFVRSSKMFGGVVGFIILGRHGWVSVFIEVGRRANNKVELSVVKDFLHGSDATLTKGWSFTPGIAKGAQKFIHLTRRKAVVTETNVDAHTKVVNVVGDDNKGLDQRNKLLDSDGVGLTPIMVSNPIVDRFRAIHDGGHDAREAEEKRRQTTTNKL